ncbi:hypothetical protein K7432_001824 [Basidiobolus ranarum]|uniref:Uncharacterized protein n=1 Tax=Basidiobolus ranarum TaxID=34480 RepID=A0ABR2W8V5_9FUNG
MNGVGCIWQKRRCFRDIKCELLPDRRCSPGCFNCGRFMCLPDGGSCPKGCDTYVTRIECQNSMPFNGVGCRWMGEACNYYELEIRNQVPSNDDIVFMFPGSNSAVVNEPTLTEPLEYTKMKLASKWGPIAGITVGLISATGMVFVLVHKRIESKRQVRLVRGFPTNELTKDVRRPQSFLKAVKHVLGSHKQEDSLASELASSLST